MNRLPSTLLIFFLLIITLSPLFLLLITSVPPGTRVDIDRQTARDTTGKKSHTFPLEKPDFLPIFMRTLIISLTGAGGIVILGAMGGYGLSKARGKLYRGLTIFFFMALLIPIHSFILPLIQQSGRWSLNTPTGLVLIYWGIGVPFSTIASAYGFRKISPSIEDSARLEGASVFRIFFTLLLPLLTPLLTPLFLGASLLIWNDFYLPSLLLPGGMTWQTALFGYINQYGSGKEAEAGTIILFYLPLVIFLSLVIRGFAGKKRFPWALHRNGHKTYNENF